MQSAGAGPPPQEGVGGDPFLIALRRQFNLPSFRPCQREAAAAVLNGQDVAVVLPTGAGKSLCYSLPAVMMRGVGVVISPLIALMADQVNGLKRRGIAAAAFHSGCSEPERRAILQDLLAPAGEPTTKLLFVTPEGLTAGSLAAALAGLHRRRLLSLIACDEAHCISSWGHQFRPSYRQLGVLRDRFPGVPILALTATATATVLKDIRSQLRIPTSLVLRQSFDRSNLEYRVVFKDQLPDPIAHIFSVLTGQDEAPAPPTRGSKPRQARSSGSEVAQSDVLGDLFAALDSEAGTGGAALSAAVSRCSTAGSCIVYCHKREDTESVAAGLSERGLLATAYHAGLPAAKRKDVQDAFTAGRVKVCCCTTAFGMGVDIADVRHVVHYTLPKDMSGFYQEAGRAGRDGQPATCTLYYSRRDADRLRFVATQEAARAEAAAAAAKPHQERGATERRATEQGLPQAAAAPRLLAMRAAGSSSTAGVGSGSKRSAGATPSFGALETVPREAPLTAGLDALAEVTAYCETAQCRRVAILRHFGEDPLPFTRCDARPPPPPQAEQVVSSTNAGGTPLPSRALARPSHGSFMVPRAGVASSLSSASAGRGHRLCDYCADPARVTEALAKLLNPSFGKVPPAVAAGSGAMGPVYGLEAEPGSRAAAAVDAFLSWMDGANSVGGARGNGSGGHRVPAFSGARSLDGDGDTEDDAGDDCDGEYGSDGYSGEAAGHSSSAHGSRPPVSKWTNKAAAEASGQHGRAKPAASAAAVGEASWSTAGLGFSKASAVAVACAAAVPRPCAPPRIGLRRPVSALVSSSAPKASAIAVRPFFGAGALPSSVPAVGGACVRPAVQEAVVQSMPQDDQVAEAAACNSAAASASVIRKRKRNHGFADARESAVKAVEEDPVLEPALSQSKRPRLTPCAIVGAGASAAFKGSASAAKALTGTGCAPDAAVSAVASYRKRAPLEVVSLLESPSDSSVVVIENSPANSSCHAADATRQTSKPPKSSAAAPQGRAAAPAVLAVKSGAAASWEAVFARYERIESKISGQTIASRRK